MSADAERSLKCAMWAAMVAGADETDAETRQALSFSMSYWIGRFEGLTGRHFDDAATVEFVGAVAGESDALATVCGPEMEWVGDRMVKWGETMQAAAE